MRIVKKSLLFHLHPLLRLIHLPQNKRREAPMRAESEDTSPEIERVQIELIRKASPAKIFNLVRSMSQTMMQASRENIQRLHPGASKEELTLIFIELYYGKELANFVRAKMERRGVAGEFLPPRQKTTQIFPTRALRKKNN